MSVPDPESIDRPHRNRVRARTVITVLVLCGAGALIYLTSRQPDETRQSAAEAATAGASQVAVESPSTMPDGDASAPESMPSGQSAEGLNIFTPKEWSGPHFMRFFAHDPVGSQELEAAYTRWRQSNYPLAEKIVLLASERADVTTRSPWVRGELDEALRWVGQLTEGETKFTLLAELGKRLFAFDRAATAILSGQLKQEIYRDAFLGEIVEEWAVKDPEASSAWVEEFPDGELRTSLQMKVAIRSAKQTPAGAAEYVSNLDPSPARDAAAQTVVRQWAVNDPRAAADWAVSYPGEELRPELLSTAVAYWSRKDANGLQRWIREDPNDGTRRMASELSAKLQPRP